MAAALPWVKPQFTDGNGKPFAGGKLYTYMAGTTIPIATFTDSTGTVNNTNPFILDADGRGDFWLAPGSYKVVLTDATDVVIWTKDKVKPADGGGGGIVDSDYTFVGYSSRFSSFFTTVGLNDTLAKILNITYTGPAISLSASGNGTIREKGATVSGTTLAATVTKRSNAINQVRFYDGATLIDTENSGGAIPNGGTSSFTTVTAFTDNKTFNAQVDDIAGGGGGPTTVSASASFTFVYPYYYGAGPTGKTPAQVAALTKQVIGSTATVNETITASASDVFYFAYPAAYGVLTSILDVNGFETLPDWTLTVANITGLDTTAQSYNIYKFNNPVVAGSYFYSFKR
jgi:hypothetical protein